MSEKRDGQLLAVALLGAAAGAMAALLFAPDTGKRTRRKIRRRVEDSADYIEGAGRDLIENCEDLCRRSAELADEGAQGLSDKYEDLLERSRKLVDETRALVSR